MSVWSSSRKLMKAGSLASVSRRVASTLLSSWTGSCRASSHAPGSTQRNRSRVRSSHAQRRFMASSSRGASASGRWARTVNVRCARTTSKLPRPLPPTAYTFRLEPERGRQTRVLGRLVIDNVRPRTPTGEWPAKAVVGESITVSADIFKDGHDILAAQVRWQPFAAHKWDAVPMVATGNDRWEATIEPSELGRHEI